MKLTFLGASEAFHETKTNISMILSSDTTNLMLDCGYNVPQKLWQLQPDKDFLDAIFVSHFHADHVAGLPMLIMRMRQDKRKKPLTLIGPIGFEKSFKEFYELVYKGFFAISGFQISFIEAKGGQKLKIGDIALEFADANHLAGTPHFVHTLAVRVNSNGGSICYSSDTVYTERITELAKGCNILIHDAFRLADDPYHKTMPAHSSPRDAAKTARKANVKKLLLFNIHRTYDGKSDELLKEARAEFSGDVAIADEGQSFEV